MSTGDALKEQGIALFQQNDYEAAAKTFRQAQEAYEAAELADMAAEMMVNIGLVHAKLEEPRQALELMQSALRTFQEIGDEMRAAQVLGNLGGVYEALGERDSAQKHYRQAADTFRDLGEEHLYSETLMAIGALQLRSGELLKGAATYQVALENREDLNGRQRVLKFFTSNITRAARRFAGVPDLPEETSQN
jgi:tetratricopeptide (TPR) repeat protein